MPPQASASRAKYDVCAKADLVVGTRFQDRLLIGSGYASDSKDVLSLGNVDMHINADTVGWFQGEIWGEEYGCMRALMRLGVVRYLLEPNGLQGRWISISTRHGVENLAWRSRMSSGADNIHDPTSIRLHKRIGLHNNFVILYKDGINGLACKGHPKYKR